MSLCNALMRCPFLRYPYTVSLCYAFVVPLHNGFLRCDGLLWWPFVVTFNVAMAFCNAFVVKCSYARCRAACVVWIALQRFDCIVLIDMAFATCPLASVLHSTDRSQSCHFNSLVWWLASINTRWPRRRSVFRREGCANISPSERVLSHSMARQIQTSYYHNTVFPNSLSFQFWLTWIDSPVGFKHLRTRFSPFSGAQVFLHHRQL